MVHREVVPSGKVRKYVVFNPTPPASTPDECTACWETKDGRWDKDMAVTASEVYEDDGEDGEVLTYSDWTGGLWH